MALLRRLTLLWALLWCAAAWAGPSLAAPAPGQLTVYFLDVGQGDAALIVSPAGKTLLVDGGPPDSASRTAAKVASVVDGPLDLVILTHPHLDHLGGLTAVMARVGAKNFMEPGFDHGTSAYARLLDFVADRKLGYVALAPPGDGEPFRLDLGGAELSVFWPRVPSEPFIRGSRSDANANSIVMRVTFGRTAFLFTGDAEADTEARLLRSGFRLHSTVLKVPHHGSRFSSQPPFIARVSPKVAVISCGAGNDYGHPHGKALQRYAAAGVKVARTDLQGDLRAVSDGERVVIDGVGSFLGAEPPPPAATAAATAPPSPTEPAPQLAPAAAPGPAGEKAVRYVASRRSEVFHRPDCPAVRRIAERNLVYFEGRDLAAAQKRPAGDCHP